MSGQVFDTTNDKDSVRLNRQTVRQGPQDKETLPLKYLSFKQYCAQYHARYAEGERRGELLQSLKTAREEVSAQPFGHNQRLRLTSFSIKPYHLR